jgi:hypothetical protein
MEDPQLENFLIHGAVLFSLTSTVEMPTDKEQPGLCSTAKYVFTQGISLVLIQFFFFSLS